MSMPSCTVALPCASTDARYSELLPAVVKNSSPLARSNEILGCGIAFDTPLAPAIVLPTASRTRRL